MVMTFWPLIERELRVRARRGMTYWSRCAVAAMATVVAVQCSLIYVGSLGTTQVGAATFAAVSWLGFVLACASALVTADTLSQERRDGTLGLLFLTQLKGWEVVLGKISAAGLTALCALVSCLPTLGLAVLAGGVTGHSIARMQLALLNAVFVALAAGMWVSSRGKDRRKTFRNALVAIVLLQVGPWIVARGFARWGSGSQFLALASPYTAFYLAADPASGARFWLALLIPHLEGWALLAGTTFYLCRNWRESETTWNEPPKVMEPLLVQEARAMSEARLRLRQEDPVCWVVSRLRGHGALLWIGTLLLFLLGGTGFSLESQVVGSWLIPGANGLWNGLNLLLNGGAGALLAWGAARSLFSAQRNGELELLLSTPLGARDIIGGHWRALCEPLRGAWLLFGLLVFLQFALLPQPDSGWSAVDAFLRIMIPVNIVLDVMAICWVGMWFGLKSQKSVYAISWTVAVVIGFPWAAAYLVDILFALASSSSAKNSPAANALLFWSCMAALLFFAKNVVLILWAASKLRRELRVRASSTARDWLR